VTFLRGFRTPALTAAIVKGLSGPAGAAPVRERAMPLFQIVHSVTTLIAADDETQAEQLARDALEVPAVEVREDAEIEIVHDGGEAALSA
jgi:hypothetical protein